MDTLIKPLIYENLFLNLESNILHLKYLSSLFSHVPFSPESELPHIYVRWLVHDNNEKTRIDILKTFQLLLATNKMSAIAKAKVRLQTIGYDSVCTLLSKQTVSRDVIIALLKLALSTEQTALKGVDIYVHFEIVNAVLSIVKLMSSPIKLEIALKVSLGFWGMVASASPYRTLPTLCPHSARTLPALSPHSSRTLPALFPHSSRTLPAVYTRYPIAARWTD